MRRRFLSLPALSTGPKTDATSAGISSGFATARGRLVVGGVGGGVVYNAGDASPFPGTGSRHNATKSGAPFGFAPVLWLG